jgi:AcrR family transcriptional regulator
VVRQSNRRSIQRLSPRRARRSDARRDGILKAASRIFRDRGFADAGMRDIADAADLSPANLYHYFRGKDELLFYCQDRALDKMLASVERARRGSQTAAAQLRQVLAAHVTTMLDEVEGAAAHLQVDTLSEVLRRQIVDKRDRYERGVRRIVERGLKNGEFTADDPAIVTRAMLGALNWTATWFRPDGRVSAERVGEIISNFLVSGVQTHA